MRSSSGKYWILIIVILFSLSTAVADAQTRRGKVKPLATPTPQVLTGAEIISQGGYEDPVITVPVEKAPAKPASGNSAKINDLNSRVKKLEAQKKEDSDEKQKRLLMNLDILTRAEGRTESLRKQLFEMIEKENSVAARLDQINYDIRPEVIERALQIQGSMKPEEVRESRRKSLEAERQNLESLMTQIQGTRINLEANLQRAEQLVEKLRTKLEKEIDDSLLPDVPDEPEN